MKTLQDYLEIMNPPESEFDKEFQMFVNEVFKLLDDYSFEHNEKVLQLCFNEIYSINKKKKTKNITSNVSNKKIVN